MTIMQGPLLAVATSCLGHQGDTLALAVLGQQLLGDVHTCALLRWLLLLVFNALRAPTSA